MFPSSPIVYEPARNLIIVLNEEFDCDVNFKFKPLIVYGFESICFKNEKTITNGLQIHNVFPKSLFCFNQHDSVLHTLFK